MTENCQERMVYFDRKNKECLIGKRKTVTVDKGHHFYTRVIGCFINFLRVITYEQYSLFFMILGTHVIIRQSTCLPDEKSRFRLIKIKHSSGTPKKHPVFFVNSKIHLHFNGKEHTKQALSQQN